MSALKKILQRSRMAVKKAAGIEPVVRAELDLSMQFHGNDYCGWNIPRGYLTRDAVVVDVGIGEDISFSRSLIETFGCKVLGFDPTPRAIEYVKQLACPGFSLLAYALAAQSGAATFYLPNNDEHVSGSLVRETHLGRRSIDVELIGMDDLFRIANADRIVLLKLDIEGAEYELIASPQFQRHAPRIDLLCIEFHHRWPSYGSASTLAAVATLRALGLQCAWASPNTNEEFLFVNTNGPNFQRLSAS